MTDPFASVPVSWHAAAAVLLQCVVKNGARKVVGNFNDNSDRTAPDRTKMCNSERRKWKLQFVTIPRQYNNLNALQLTVLLASNYEGSVRSCPGNKTLSVNGVAGKGKNS